MTSKKIFFFVKLSHISPLLLAVMCLSLEIIIRQHFKENVPEIWDVKWSVKSLKAEEIKMMDLQEKWLSQSVSYPTLELSSIPNTKILFTQFHPCQNGKTDIWIEFDLRIWISISTWYLTILRPANWLSSGSRIQNFSFNSIIRICYVQFLIRKEFPSPISSMRIAGVLPYEVVRIFCLHL